MEMNSAIGCVEWPMVRIVSACVSRGLVLSDEVADVRRAVDWDGRLASGVVIAEPRNRRRGSGFGSGSV